MINLLRDLPITMLVPTHDMRLAGELFPRTILMDKGLIVAGGATKKILEDEKFLNEHGLSCEVGQQLDKREKQRIDAGNVCHSFYNTHLVTKL